MKEVINSIGDDVDPILPILCTRKERYVNGKPVPCSAPYVHTFSHQCSLIHMLAFFYILTSINFIFFCWNYYSACLCLVWYISIYQNTKGVFFYVFKKQKTALTLIAQSLNCTPRNRPYIPMEGAFIQVQTSTFYSCITFCLQTLLLLCAKLGAEVAGIKPASKL